MFSKNVWKWIGAALLALVILFLIVKVVSESGAVGDSVSIKSLRNKYPERAEMINDIEKAQALVAENPETIVHYATLGLAWKSLADQTLDTRLYREARKVYEEAMKITEAKNSLFILNAGDMALREKLPAVAEEYYKLAVQNVPGDDSTYLNLASFYINTQRRPEEVLEVLNKGIEIVVPPIQLILARAQFYKDIGLYKESLQDYQLVQSARPSEAVANVIQELKELQN